jgi:hypothetical protein
MVPDASMETARPRLHRSGDDGRHGDAEHDEPDRRHEVTL